MPLPPPPTTTGATPTQLCEGRYRVVRTLGVGGMATVVLAWDTRLDVYRAIKLLAPHLSERESIRRRFESEAKVLARLHHPNIVGVHDVGVDRGQPFIVMEFVSGGSLNDRVEERGALPPRMAAEVGIALLDALSAAHERNIVHRDVKPHNILVTQDGTCKLTDFGIAQITGEEQNRATRTGSMMGTLAYMAPEQRVSAKDIDARADVYAAAATVFALVAGRDPFDLYSTELFDELFSGFDPALAEVVKRGARYRPEERYPTARAMADALRSVLPMLAPTPDDIPPLAMPASFDTSKAPAAPVESASSGTFIDDGDMASPPTLSPASAPPSTVATGSGGTVVVGGRGAHGTVVDATGSAASAAVQSIPAGPPSPSRTPLWVGAGVLVAAGVAWFALGRSAPPAPAPEPAPAAVSAAPVVTPAAPQTAPTPPASGPAAPTAPAAPAATKASGAPAPTPRPAQTAPRPAAPAAAAGAPAAPSAPAPAAAPVAAAPPAAAAPSGAPGTLILNSRPWSKVRIGGVEKGMTGWKGEVPSGRVAVTLTAGDGRTVERTLNVRPGEPTRFCYDFDLGSDCPR